MIKPTGIDISRWQHPINWAKMEAAKPAFLVQRATIAKDYIDPFFMSTVAECQNRAIPFSAYHVVRCDYTAKDQMVNFSAALKLSGATKTSLPLVLDCELDNGKPPAVIADIVYTCCKILEDKYGKKPMIYSRKQWVETHIGFKYWLNDYDWWIAFYPNDWKHYDRIPEPPAPVDLDKVKIHQVSANGDGKPYGVASGNIDIDWWMDDQESLDKYISDYTGTGIPLPDKTIIDRVAALEKEAKAHGWSI